MMRVPPRKPLNLERRPSVTSPAKPGAWIAQVAAMTQGGKLDTIPRPLPENATRLRRKLWERRREEQEQRA